MSQTASEETEHFTIQNMEINNFQPHMMHAYKLITVAAMKL